MAATLPTELLSQIFQISAGLDHESIGILSSVCQRWRSIAVDSPQLWRKLVLNGSGKTSLEALRAKANLWLSIPSTTAFDIDLLYGEHVDKILPMVSYIIPEPTKWMSMKLVKPDPAMVVPNGPYLWYYRSGLETKSWMMGLVIGPSSRAVYEGGFSIGIPRCGEGLQYHTFCVVLPTHSILTTALQPFIKVKSLYLARDIEDGVKDVIGSHCQKTIEVLAAFPFLESLHMWNQRAPLHFGSPRLLIPNLVHLCVSQPLGCMLSHIAAPKLEHFHLDQSMGDEEELQLSMIAEQLDLDPDGGVHSGPGLALKMMFQSFSLPLKKLDIRNLTEHECIWIISNIGTLEVVRLSHSVVKDEAMRLLTVGTDGQCQLPRLFSLKLGFVEGFSARAMCEMVRSRVGGLNGIRPITSLVLESCCRNHEGWDLDPRWSEMIEILGDGFYLVSRQV